MRLRMKQLAVVWRRRNWPRRPLSAMSLLLPVLLLSGDILAQNPMGYIPGLNAKVTSLCFFESALAPNVTPHEQRVYSSCLFKVAG